MKTIKTALISATMLAAPLVSSADNSFVDTYQFGTGSHGEPSRSVNSNPSVHIYDIYAKDVMTSEQVDMGMMQEVSENSIKDEPSIPGYIGTY